MKKEQKEMRKFVEKDAGGITLIALVVTIIVLIILAGITISMTVGDNGIFTKAKEAKKMQVIAEAKEKIGVEILDAQVEAIERNEELEQAQVEDIISKYGTLQDDKDTIILKDNGYKISLLDIYQGTTTSSGSYTENKAKIELLEEQVKRLQEQLDSMSQTGDEKDKTIAELNDKVTTIENEKNELQNENNSLTSKATELTNLKETLSKVTETEGQILNDYTAYKYGKLITGTMVNYVGKTVTASTVKQNGTNAEITIPSAGYYGTDSKISVPVETIKNNVSELNSKMQILGAKTSTVYMPYVRASVSWNVPEGTSADDVVCYIESVSYNTQQTSSSSYNNSWNSNLSWSVSGTTLTCYFTQMKYNDNYQCLLTINAVMIK